MAKSPFAELMATNILTARSPDPIAVIVQVLRARGFSNDQIRETIGCEMRLRGPKWALEYAKELDPAAFKPKEPEPLWVTQQRAKVEVELLGL